MLLSDLCMFENVCKIDLELISINLAVLSLEAVTSY
jgi:hypothetical protein